MKENITILRNELGKYFRINRYSDMTEVVHVDTPAEATVIVTGSGRLHTPSYYLENSDRMKRWVEGFEFVSFERKITFTEIPKKEKNTLKYSIRYAFGTDFEMGAYKTFYGTCETEIVCDILTFIKENDYRLDCFEELKI